MTGKREAVRNLPWLFLFLMATGVGVIWAGLVWIGDAHTELLYFVITVFVFVLLLSMVAHLWLFCRLSGRPIGDVRRPTLILHGAVILPAPFLFIAAFFMALAGHVDLGGQVGLGVQVFLVWGGVALILIILEARLLGSRHFSLIFGSRSLEKRLGAVVFSGVFVWMLSALLFGAMLGSSNL